MTYPVFPALAGIAWPVKRTPVASSLRQKAISGRETFQPLWPGPLYKYELSFALLRADAAHAEWQQLLGFWNGVMFAPGGVFAFDDASDDSAALEPTGTGDGSTSAFQLVRSLGGFAEPVLNPTCTADAPGTTLDYGSAASAPTLDLDYGNGIGAPGAALDYGYCATLQVFAAGLLAPYALSPGGVVTITPPPADGTALTWSGGYTWLCRFDEDALELSNFMYLFWELKKCTFTSIRL